MPQWIHDRAKRIMESTKKEYGKEKGEEIAFALATQQAHATGKAPKKWKGKPFGTPEAKREAKAKYDEPSKMQKSAFWPFSRKEQGSSGEDPFRARVRDHLRKSLRQDGINREPWDDEIDEVLQEGSLAIYKTREERDKYSSFVKKMRKSAAKEEEGVPFDYAEMMNQYQNTYGATPGAGPSTPAAPPAGSPEAVPAEAPQIDTTGYASVGPETPPAETPPAAPPAAVPAVPPPAAPPPPPPPPVQTADVPALGGEVSSIPTSTTSWAPGSRPKTQEHLGALLAREYGLTPPDLEKVAFWPFGKKEKKSPFEEAMPEQFGDEKWEREIGRPADAAFERAKDKPTGQAFYPVALPGPVDWSPWQTKQQYVSADDFRAIARSQMWEPKQIDHFLKHYQRGADLTFDPGPMHADHRPKKTAEKVAEDVAPGQVYVLMPDGSYLPVTPNESGKYSYADDALYQKNAKGEWENYAPPAPKEEAVKAAAKDYREELPPEMLEALRAHYKVRGEDIARRAGVSALGSGLGTGLMSGVASSGRHGIDPGAVAGGMLAGGGLGALYGLGEGAYDRAKVERALKRGELPDFSPSITREALIPALVAGGASGLITKGLVPDTDLAVRNALIGGGVSGGIGILRYLALKAQDAALKREAAMGMAEAKEGSLAEQILPYVMDPSPRDFEKSAGVFGALLDKVRGKREHRPSSSYSATKPSEGQMGLGPPVSSGMGITQMGELRPKTAQAAVIQTPAGPAVVPAAVPAAVPPVITPEARTMDVISLMQEHPELFAPDMGAGYGSMMGAPELPPEPMLGGPMGPARGPGRQAPALLPVPVSVEDAPITSTVVPVPPPLPVSSATPSVTQTPSVQGPRKQPQVSAPKAPGEQAPSPSQPAPSPSGKPQKPQEAQVPKKPPTPAPVGGAPVQQPPIAQQPIQQGRVGTASLQEKEARALLKLLGLAREAEPAAIRRLAPAAAAPVGEVASTFKLGPTGMARASTPPGMTLTPQELVYGGGNALQRLKDRITMLQRSIEGGSATAVDVGALADAQKAYTGLLRANLDLAKRTGVDWTVAGMEQAAALRRAVAAPMPWEIIKEAEDELDSAVAKFLIENQDPSDDELHQWAMDNGYDKEAVEEAIYRLASKFVQFSEDGKARKEDVAQEDVDPEESNMGVEVEKEHTPDEETARRIARDHLAEIPDYYTRLKEMEDKAKAEAGKKEASVSFLPLLPHFLAGVESLMGGSR